MSILSIAFTMLRAQIFLQSTASSLQPNVGRDSSSLRESACLRSTTGRLNLRPKKPRDSGNPFDPALSRLLTVKISEASFTSAARQPGKSAFPNVFSPQNHCLLRPDGISDSDRLRPLPA
jgi:hypothetical protein